MRDYSIEEAIEIINQCDESFLPDSKHFNIIVQEFSGFFKPERFKNKSFLFGSQILTIKTIKVSAEIADWIFAVPIVGQIRLVHVEFLVADKTGFNLFFCHVKTLKKRKL